MIKNEIEQLLKPLIEDLGYELWGCEYLAQGRHSLLRIYIDKEDGIGLEDCERVSRQVSAVLDVEDPIPGNYSLEVSSPGIPRPLFNQEQYKRYVGEEVRLKLFKPINGSRTITAVIVSADEDNLVLKIDDEQLEVQFNQIVKANLTSE
ncbi:ribosome maturation factor RimP [Legionella jordanis]|uniref:Ribosome maturation factor RimP n=1 Tax=Legionella jordanis TaxID=456 RepID=A0A0W0VDB6_9GAMM|nr:ribosome maturation factor RimP [Legionella jordanis]KTD18140.1 Ribosome maturation factor RimP [Legionella jordanis]RMX00550.1 ribosome maturation factor RimP [Legionella jordanis]RMX21333.1 ribosome maturation factor RimP [Legionella jordanis]VEH13767.1 NusA-like protein [Legionella jordanis]HAT8714150.1 ribosome maturation factor RimP [Legionella jordanis]